MGMTNRQFQGFVRLTIAQMEETLKESPDNKKLKQLLEIFQAMLEDGKLICKLILKIYFRQFLHFITKYDILAKSMSKSSWMSP